MSTNHPQQPLAVPDIRGIDNLGEGQLTSRIGPVHNARQYEVRYKLDSAADWSPSLLFNSTRGLTVHGLPPGDTYAFEVGKKRPLPGFSRMASVTIALNSVMAPLSRLLVLFLLLVLNGCAPSVPPETAAMQMQRVSAEVDARKVREQVRRDSYIAAHPQLSEEIKGSIHEGRYAIGMTEDDALVCMSELDGRLRKVNRDTNAYGFRDQWVLYNGGYLYFNNGTLESIQTSGGGY